MADIACVAWAVFAAGGFLTLLLWFLVNPVNDDNRWTAVTCSFILANAYIVGRILGG